MSAERLAYDEFCRTLGPVLAKAGITETVTRIYQPEIIFEFCLNPENHNIHKATIYVVTPNELQSSVDTHIKKIQGMSVFMSVYYKIEELEGGNQNISVNHIHSYVGPDNPMLDILSVKILHALPKIFEQIHLRYTIDESPMAILEGWFSQLGATLSGPGTEDMQKLHTTKYQVSHIEDKYCTDEMLCTGPNGCAETCDVVGVTGDHH